MLINARGAQAPARTKDISLINKMMVNLKLWGVTLNVLGHQQASRTTSLHLGTDCTLLCLISEELPTSFPCRIFFWCFFFFMSPQSGPANFTLILFNCWCQMNRYRANLGICNYFLSVLSVVYTTWHFVLRISAFFQIQFLSWHAWSLIMTWWWWWQDRQGGTIRGRRWCPLGLIYEKLPAKVITFLLPVLQDCRLKSTQQ